MQRINQALALAVSLLLACWHAAAQLSIQRNAHPPACSFEIASIHASDGATFTHVFIEGNESTFHGYSYSARDLVKTAYQLIDGQQVAGYPRWAETEKYDIVAKVSAEQAASKCLRDPDARGAAILELLQQRFALKVHTEKRTISQNALSVIPGRLKLASAERTARQKQQFPDETVMLYPPFTVTVEHASIGQFAPALSRILDRNVTDRTGLTGRYTFALKYSDESSGPGMTPPSDDRPPLFTALNEQLGLKLTKEKP